MNRWALVLLVLLSALSARAGYRELDREIEDYQPPVFYFDALHDLQQPHGDASAVDAEFRAQIENLRRERERWQKTLVAPAPRDGFWSSNATGLQLLSAAAQDPDVAAAAVAGEFTLPTLEALVWLRNPGIAAAGLQAKAALQRYDQAANLDEVLRQYQAFTEGVMAGVGPMKGREPPQMGFPYPDMVALKGQVVNQDMLIAAQALEIARRDALTAARGTYWNLGFLREAVRLTGEMERLLGDLLAVATTRYESGKASFQDVVKVRMRLDTLVEERNTLREKHADAQAMLRRLLDLEHTVTLGEPRSEDPVAEVMELGALLELAQERRQELRRLDAMISKMERMVWMGEARLHADPTLNLSLNPAVEVMQTGTARMQEPFAVTTTATMGVGSPVKAWYGSGEAYLRETREKLSALREKRRDMAAMVQLEVRRAWSALDQAVRERELYARSLVELAETALEVSTRGYETGRVMFADVIASHTEWLQAHLGAARRRADIGVARAELAAAIGAELP